MISSSIGNNTYNILIMLDESYIKLGLLFLNSLYKNCNLGKIKTIYVGDLGLSDNSKSLLKYYYDKISIINSLIKLNSTHIHSNNWVKAVSQKTKTLLKLVQNIKESIVLLDVDMIIMDDFYKQIDRNYDLQVCKREKPSFRHSLVNRKDKVNKFKLEYIASFLIINNKETVPF